MKLKIQIRTKKEKENFLFFGAKSCKIVQNRAKSCKIKDLQ